MAQVVDSAQWTGISTDPFAALSTEERNGLVRYDVTYDKSLRIFLSLVFFALVGLVIAAVSLTVGVKPTARSQNIEQIINKLGVDFNTSVLVFGLALFGAMVLGLITLNRNLRAAATRCAPLIVSGSYLSIGTPANKVLLRTIDAVRFQPAIAFSTPADEPAFPFPKPANEYSKLEVHYGVSEPLIVDPAVLNEKSDRIAAVLQYRVLKARGELDA